MSDSFFWSTVVMVVLFFMLFLTALLGDYITIQLIVFLCSLAFFLWFSFIPVGFYSYLSKQDEDQEPSSKATVMASADIETDTEAEFHDQDDRPSEI